MELILSKHAKDEVDWAVVKLAYVEATLSAPDWTEPDPNDPALTRSFKAILEFGNRVLRVVHRPEGPDILIVTAFFDRGARRR